MPQELQWDDAVNHLRDYMGKMSTTDLVVAALKLSGVKRMLTDDERMYLMPSLRHLEVEMAAELRYTAKAKWPYHFHFTLRYKRNGDDEPETAVTSFHIHEDRGRLRVATRDTYGLSVWDALAIYTGKNSTVEQEIKAVHDYYGPRS